MIGPNKTTRFWKVRNKYLSFLTPKSNVWTVIFPCLPQRLTSGPRPLSLLVFETGSACNALKLIIQPRLYNYNYSCAPPNCDNTPAPASQYRNYRHGLTYFTCPPAWDIYIYIWTKAKPNGKVGEFHKQEEQASVASSAVSQAVLPLRLSWWSGVRLFYSQPWWWLPRPSHSWWGKPGCSWSDTLWVHPQSHRNAHPERRQRQANDHKDGEASQSPCCPSAPLWQGQNNLRWSPSASIKRRRPERPPTKGHRGQTLQGGEAQGGNLNGSREGVRGITMMMPVGIAHGTPSYPFIFILQAA